MHPVLTRRAPLLLLSAALLLPAVGLGPAPAVAATRSGTADPAPSATGGVTVLTARTFLTYGDELNIVLEVRNDWNRVARFPTAEVALLDAGGATLDTAYVQPHTDLLPGERGVLYGSRDRPDGYASFRVGPIKRSPSRDVVPNHGFRVEYLGQTPDDRYVQGFPDRPGRTLRGRITNLNRTPAEGPVALFHLRDSAGVLYDTAEAFVDQTLQPGQTVDFTAGVFPGDPFDEGGTVDGTGESGSAPSPYPTDATLQTSTSSVVAGQEAEVSALVYAAGTEVHAPKDLPVQLWGREQGQTSFRLLRSSRTDQYGAASWKLKPQRDIVWQVRVPASSTVGASASRTPVTKVAFAVASSGAASGGSFVATGRVTPARSGVVVRLQQLYPGPTRVVASGRVGSGGAFRLTTPLRKGTTFYRVVVPAVPGNQEGLGGLLGIRTG